jgi:hypothetical protein
LVIYQVKSITLILHHSWFLTLMAKTPFMLIKRDHCAARNAPETRPICRCVSGSLLCRRCGHDNMPFQVFCKNN